jgi:hypothetical protein
VPVLQLRPDLPPRLASAIEHALVKVPAGRYAGAQAFAHALAPFADARSVAVLQRIDAGVGAAAPLPAAFAPTPPAGAGRGGTAMMEPVQLQPPSPGAAQPDAVRAPQRTVVADGPVAFQANPNVTAIDLTPAVPPAMSPVPSAPVSAAPLVPPPPPDYGRPERGGGGRTGLLVVLGVLAFGLIGTGIYFAVAGGSSGSGSSPTPTAKPTAEEPEDDTPEGKKKKKKKSEGDQAAAEPAETQDGPTGTPTPPPGGATAAKPVKTAPSTSTGAAPSTSTSAAPAASASASTKPSTSTTAAPPPFTLPSGWTLPGGGGTTAPPATTTAPPATTTAPPATTTAPPPVVPTMLPGKFKPKFSPK